MAFDKHQIKSLLKDDDVHVILAGAGSGKTTTMIGRMLRAINHEAIMKQLPLGVKQETIDGDKIRAVSFTNVAANTLKTRLLHFNDKDADEIEVSTMDKFCIQIIRQIYPNALITNDESQISRTMYYKMNDELGLQSDYKNYSEYYDVIYDGSKRYSKTADRHRKHFRYDSNLDKYVEYVIKNIKHKDDEVNIPLPVVYRFAVSLMIKHQFVPDIDLLILDEFQDTSDSQFLIVNFLLTQIEGLKFVGIGDISQSMYRWNNAKPQRVSQFIDEYQAGVSTLPNNYRSHPEIIKFANDLLKINLDNISNIQLNPASKASHDPAIIDENRVRHIEREYLFGEIQSLLIKGVEPKDIAVITRTNSKIKKLKDDLNALSTKKFDFDTSHFDKNNQMQWLQQNIRQLSSFITHVQDFTPNLVHSSIDRFAEHVIDELERFYIIDDANPVKNYYLKAIFNDRKQGTAEFIKYLGTRLERLKEKLERLMWTTTQRDESAIFLSTVHGVKGEEFKYVFYMPTPSAPDRSIKVSEDMPKDEREILWGSYAETQNIHYVAATRAIEQLTIISEGNELLEKRNKLNQLIAQDKPYNADMDVLLQQLNQPIYRAKQYGDDGEPVMPKDDDDEEDGE